MSGFSRRALALVFAGFAAAGCDTRTTPLEMVPELRDPTPFDNQPLFSQASTIPSECPTGATKWATAVNGSWADATKWTAGVPTGSTPACIDLPGTYVVTIAGSGGGHQFFVKSLFLGVPGQVLQPTIRVAMGRLMSVEDMVVHGRIDLASPGGCCGDRGSYAISLATLLVAPTATLANVNTGFGMFEGVSIENEGLITTPGTAGVQVRASTLINRGRIEPPAGRIMNLTGPSAGGVLTTELIDGTVNVLGTLRHQDGTLHVRGGVVNGIINLDVLEELNIEHDTDGQFNINGPGGLQPPNLVTLRGVIGANQHVWIGRDHMTVSTPGLVNRGLLEIEHVGSFARQGTVLQTNAGAIIVNEGTISMEAGPNSGAALHGAITNEANGVITAIGGGGAVIRATPLINRGSVRIASGIMHVQSNGTTPPEVILEGGDVTVTAPGTFHQTLGKMSVNGGVVNGILELNTLGELHVEHDAGGRYDMNGPGGNQPVSFSVLSGVVGPNQHVRMGIRHMFVEAASGFINRGLITVEHVGALATTSTVFQSATGGSITNEGTINLLQGANSSAVLAGSITNAANGVITTTGGGGAIVQANPLTNRGTIRTTSSQLNVHAHGATPPLFILDGGKLELTLNYAQIMGEFRFLNGEVTASVARTPVFDRVNFTGHGTFGRPLTITGVGGSLSPGVSPGQITVTGDYTPSAFTTTLIELGGAAPATGYDQVVVNGVARFNGPLSVALINSFVPRACQTFEVVKYTSRVGTFTNPTVPIDIGNGMKLRQVYTPTSLVLVAYSANGPNVSPTDVEVSVSGQTATYDVCIGAGADVITVSPDNQVLVDKTTLTFAGSQLPQTVTVSAAPGATRETAVITHRASSNTPVANVNVRIRGIVLPDVDPPVTTASATPQPNANGWNNTNVTVDLSATDAGTVPSGVKEIVWQLTGAQTGGATVSGSATTVTVSAEGTTRLTYFARDNRGNEEAPKHLDLRIDKTAPSVNAARAPDANAHGWNNADVTATFTATDGGSGIDGDASVQVVFANEGANQSATRTFRDRAGNEASASVSGINIDKTAPNVAVTRDPPAGPNGWNSTSVTATFTATDALSGVDGSASENVVFANDGENQTATRTFSDRAGNEASATITGINIDRTPPQLTCKATPDVIWPANNKLVDVSIAMTFSESITFKLTAMRSNEPEPNDFVDFVIGTPDTQGKVKASRNGNGTGRIYTFEYTGADAGGNTSVASCHVRVPHDQNKK